MKTDESVKCFTKKHQVRDKTIVITLKGLFNSIPSMLYWILLFLVNLTHNRMPLQFRLCIDRLFDTFWLANIFKAERVVL